MATDKLINSTQGADIIDKLDDIADKIHNVNYGLETTSAGVVQMAGYQKSSETTPGAISKGDTVNQAMGKLEKRIDNDEAALAGKQATLTTEQLAAVNSGIDSTKVGQIATNQSNISSLQANTVPNTRTVNSKSLSSDITLTAADVGAIATTAKGAASGVAELDANGKVPSAQLPSYVDDVLEYSSKSSFPATGETGKIYVDTSTNKTYRWSSSAYVEISESLALGETSSTAYRGDRGKAAYDHSQITSGNPHNVTKSDVGLSNVGNFKAVSTVASQGLTDTEKSNARTNIGAGTGNGTYSKPSGGIPKTDLASAVQTSLGKADTALQSFTETDPTVPSWAKASSKPSYNSDEISDTNRTHKFATSAQLNQISTNQANAIHVLNKSGKNLLELNWKVIKQYNTSGTWIGNRYTVSGVMFTFNDDMSITISGKATSNINVVLAVYTDYTLDNWKMLDGNKLTGCPSGGAWNKYALKLQMTDSPWSTAAQDTGSGSTIYTSDIPSNAAMVALYLSVYSGYPSSSMTFKPMVITPGDNDIDSSYVPHSLNDYWLTMALYQIRDMLTAQQISPCDFNTLTKQGTYLINQNGSTNLPWSRGEQIYLTVIRPLGYDTGAQYVMQIGRAINYPQEYCVRYKYQGTWTGWYSYTGTLLS